MTYREVKPADENIYAILLKMIRQYPLF